ncbi:hypothetical protein BVD88_12205 [Neisseria meningitidis]|nr:hypothetical protein BVD88_12205 [Neisseria meningitidis]
MHLPYTSALCEYLNRHSRAGGNPDLSARKLIGEKGFFRFYVLDSHFRGNDAEKWVGGIGGL